MSFIVEVPSVFTKQTQIASRYGNTLLTGNEQINGSLLVRGSLTLNGDPANTTFKLDSYDISNLNIWQTADISYAKLGTLEVTKTSTLNTLSVANQSIFSGISCEHLKVNDATTLNDATLSSALVGTLQVTGNSTLDNVVCDTIQGNNATFLDAYITDISGLNLDVSFLNVSVGILNVVTCESLQVNNGSVFNGATFVDISVSNLDVTELSVNGHSDLADVSCETLEVEHAIFKDSIYYQTIDRSVVTNMGPLFWIVAGESVSRINATHLISLTNILQGTIFGKKYWTPKASGTIRIEQDFTAAAWAVALVFGVSTSGVLFSTNLNHIVYNGQTLSVNGDISGISIPAFSVMVVNKAETTYSVYMNGVLSYSSSVAASTITTEFPKFGGGQLLACALWNTTLTEAQIETLTLETLT
ncbi:MAG: hypothetical protein ACO3HJ_04245 [Methylophilaceae bacterium]